MPIAHPLGGSSKAAPSQPAVEASVPAAALPPSSGGGPQTGAAAASSDEPSIHAAAQRGDVSVIDALVKAGRASVDDRDDQNVTPLHWASINAQLGACRYLLDAGADVDALGGDLVATPLQWAARNGHLYVMHLLISYGADPSLCDSQGFNTLHLVTHSSMVMPLLFSLHQPVAVDAKDSDGHTALMWAAYQGDAISVDLLLRHGASVATRDGSGLTPLHWAIVKGNKVSLRRLIEAGADLEAKDDAGKTSRDMARELKSEPAFERALEEAGRGVDGRPKIRRLDERAQRIAIFALPIATFYLISSVLTIFPWYSGPFMALGLFYGMHHLITRVILDFNGAGDGLARSPYFASIIVMSIFYVTQCWFSRVLYTPGHSILNMTFFIACSICSVAFYRAITLDPGFVPLPSGDAEVKETIEELTSQGKLNGTTFDIVDMVKKPLRSKHCRITDRCVARFDHYCPWVWNAVGAGNHREFLVFVASLVAGITSFVALSLYYFNENAPTWTPETGAPCVLPAALCTAAGHDTHLFLVTLWAGLQLTWTIILLASQVWQVCRQMTTLEVSNLGRYGFMGGRGGASLRDQSGALAAMQSHAAASGSGGMGAGALGEAALDPNDLEDGVVAPPPLPPVGSAAGSLSSHGHAHGHAGHRHGPGGCFAFLLQILGLDRFTRGKAAHGLRLANKDANPFDQGVISNCFDFWTMGGGLGVDYRKLYDIPPNGWASSSQPSKTLLPTFFGGAHSGGDDSGRGYQPVRQSDEDV